MTVVQINYLSNDIQSNIIEYLTPIEMCLVSSVSTLFNHFINSIDWLELSNHPNIHYLIYNKTNDFLPIKYLVLKGWIEFEKACNNKKSNQSRASIRWPLSSKRLSRESGILITGGAFLSENTETLFMPQTDSEFKQLQNLPFNLGAMASTLVDDRCLFFGGWNNDLDESTDKMMSFYLDDNKWSIAIYFLGGSDNPYRGADVCNACYLHLNQPINFQSHIPEDWLQVFILTLCIIMKTSITTGKKFHQC